MFNYVGQAIEVSYETGYLFRIDYLTDNTLHWESLKERTDGAPMVGEEEFFAEELGDEKYFINWIEEGGLVVSQVVDFKKKVATAFMTWNEDGKRGERGHLLHNGTIKIL